MKTASLHPREKERLESLDHLNILDTIPEKDFDDITYLASQICNTPISLISLVDSSRQWFKSKHGTSASETPRELAFCSHAILQDEVFVVEDARLDERFHDNPLVAGDPHVLFYAGAPIYSPDQLPMGTLCVIDNKPRKLSAEQINSLKALSNQVKKLLDYRMQINNLKANNEKLAIQKEIFQNMQEGVVLYDSKAQIVEFNPSALRILNVTATELLSGALRNNHKLVKEDGSKYPTSEIPVLFTLATGQKLQDVQIGIQNPSDEIRWFSVSTTPLFFNSSTSPDHIVVIFTDVTNQKKSQHAMMHTAKMSSLGEIAGGIAHEINTPLAIICSTTDQILDQSLTFDKKSFIEKIKRIATTSQRIAKIVKGLRTFARDSNDDPWEVVHVTTAMNDAISLCAEKFNYEHIQIEFDVNSDARVFCIPTSLAQVFLNLLINARDAIVDQSDRWIKIKIESIDQNFRISVIDSGSGISDHLLEKIMLPFFTTKEIGKGNGLGLSISKGIIETFGGKLYYDIEDGHTCFRVEMPKAKEL